MKIVVEIVTRTEEIHSLRRTDVEPGNRATEQNVWAKYWSASNRLCSLGCIWTAQTGWDRHLRGWSWMTSRNFGYNLIPFPYCTYKSPVFEMENSRGKNISLYQYNVSSWYFFKARSFSHIWVSKWIFPRRNISGFFDEQISIHFCGWFWANISQTLLFSANLRKDNSYNSFFVQTF